MLKNRYHYYNRPLIEEFENTKGVIRIRKLKKNEQHNDQKKKYKRTNNDLQNIHHILNIGQMIIVQFLTPTSNLE